MAEQFLTLMADLDENTQRLMNEWYLELQKAGFSGTQTPDIPYHISMATYAVEKETEAVELTKRIAASHPAFTISFNHIGIFPGGNVLFAAPDNCRELQSLRDDCSGICISSYPWTPHATILIDEADTISRAIPEFIKLFRPFTADIVQLHLCAFWPTREISAAELRMP